MPRREATQEDIPAIVALGAQFHASADYGFAYTPAKIERVLKHMISSQNDLVLVSDGTGGTVTGVLLGTCYENLWGTDLIASELAWWFDPSSRGGRAAIHLVQDFEKWAVAKGCRLISLSMLENLKGGAVSRLYSRMGYKQREATFLKTLAGI